jgi:hypothetical protein
VLLHSPGHAGLAALQLPLVAAGSDTDAAGAAGGSSAEAAMLLRVWQAVGSWTAMPGVRGRRVQGVVIPSPAAAAATAVTVHLLLVTCCLVVLMQWLGAYHQLPVSLEQHFSTDAACA